MRCPSAKPMCTEEPNLHSNVVMDVCSSKELKQEDEKDGLKDWRKGYRSYLIHTVRPLHVMLFNHMKSPLLACQTFHSTPAVQ